MAHKKKKKPKLDAEKDEERGKVNPFADRDEESGVDLDNPSSNKNSFLDEDPELDRDWDDPEDDILDEEDYPDLDL